MEGVKKKFVRLPADLNAWIEQRAEQEERSRTAIIVRALRAQMQLEAREMAVG
jgi:hypothetical protein